jgi:hypothetical protein
MKVLNISMEEGMRKFLLSDSNLNSNILKSLNILKVKNIDTLGYFSISYPFTINEDRTIHESYTTTIHLFWQENGLIFVEKFSNNFNYGIIQSDSLKSIFSFYAQNCNDINGEYIMPVIFSGKIDSSGNFSYSGPTFFHEGDFSIFLQIKNDVKFLNFSNSDLTDQTSIFYNYNVNSKSYILFSMINKLLNSVTKRSIPPFFHQ